MGEFLEIFDFADRVHVETFGALFGLGGDFEFFYGDEMGRVGAEMAAVDDGEGTFAEFFAWKVNGS